MTYGLTDFDDLKRRNRPLNAFLDWDETATFGKGPLSGVTVGVKANIQVRGLPWHAGLAGLGKRIATRDAETVACLRKAGAVILGTLNMEEAALGSKTDNPHFGATQNPHRLTYSPGGSSGGSGAAVAAGLCDAALGTDTLGSIRIPASHCGVYGFKPATDRVSQNGLEPADLTLDAIGPLARDIDMLEQVASVMSDLGGQLQNCRGAVLLKHGVEVSAPVQVVYQRALAALPAKPAQVRLTQPNTRIRFAGFIQISKMLALTSKEDACPSDALVQLLSYGPRRSAKLWEEDQAVLAATRSEMRRIVEEHGFLILPTVPNLPFPHSEPEPVGQADFTCLANIAGLPALSLPAGWSEDELPVGVQIVCRPGQEAGLFTLARYLDEKLGAYRPPPDTGE